MQINILKSSIKKNPNAGRTSFFMPSGRRVTGTFIGKFPKRYEERAIVTSITHTMSGNPLSQFEIMDRIRNNKIPKWVFTDKRVRDVSISQEGITYEGLPEPNYFYKYENKHIRCSDCGVKTPFKKIEEDYIDDEYHVYICPNCKSISGYPHFTFQKIEEAVGVK